MKQDWEIVHKDTCTEQPDKRKVKAGKKEDSGGSENA